jgi:hypothetical protein
MSAAPATAPVKEVSSVPPVQRRRTERQLATARDLRPRDIFELHGIPPATLGDYVTRIPEERRPLSRFIKGRGGRKGIRLFPRTAFEAWLKCYDSAGNFDTAKWASIRAQYATA